MKYIKLFETHNEYEAYINDRQNLVLPNVSFCEDTAGVVHYNQNKEEHDYSQDYLTFVALEDGTFQFTNAINYSIDNGDTWSTLQAGTSTPTITSGNKILWKGNLIPQEYVGSGTFSSSGNFDVEGNILSLFYSDDFEDKNSFEQVCACFNMFKSCTSLINAENLVFPTTLKHFCYTWMFEGCVSLVTAPKLPATTQAAQYDVYHGMFKGCTSLTKAPELPLTSISNNAYCEMFSGCTNLNYIKMMGITGIGNSYGTRNWVSGVAPSGTFVKNSAATWNETGVDGIPNGWTVEYASE